MSRTRWRGFAIRAIWSKILDYLFVNFELRQKSPADIFRNEIIAETLGTIF